MVMALGTLASFVVVLVLIGEGFKEEINIGFDEESLVVVLVLIGEGFKELQ